MTRTFIRIYPQSCTSSPGFPRRQRYGREAALLQLRHVDLDAVAQDDIARFLVRRACTEPLALHRHGHPAARASVALRCHGHGVGTVEAPGNEGMSRCRLAADRAFEVDRGGVRRTLHIALRT